MAVHIGEEIERRRAATGMTKTELAKRLGVDRSHLYTIIAAPSMDTNMLRRTSDILGMNFFQLLAVDYDAERAISPMSVVSEGVAIYGRRSAPKRPPIRLVIEVDPDDPDAQRAAAAMAAELEKRTKH